MENWRSTYKTCAIDEHGVELRWSLLDKIFALLSSSYNVSSLGVASSAKHFHSLLQTNFNLAKVWGSQWPIVNQEHTWDFWRLSPTCNCWHEWMKNNRHSQAPTSTSWDGGQPSQKKASSVLSCVSRKGWCADIEVWEHLSEKSRHISERTYKTRLLNGWTIMDLRNQPLGKCPQTSFISSHHFNSSVIATLFKQISPFC